MGQHEQKEATSVDRIQVELLGMLSESVPGQRWVSARQRKIWRPPTDVYETNDCVVVKVEIAGMAQEDFSISLEARKLIISGIRRELAEKLGYQQMEILYGHFETHVLLPGAVDVEQIEAAYQNGFLRVRLPKARPHQVPVVSTDDSS